MNASISIFLVFLLLFGAIAGAGFLLSENNTQKATILQLQEQISRLQAQITQLQAGLTTCNEQSNGLKGQVDALTIDLNQARQDLKAYEDQLAEVYSQKAALEAALAESNAANNELTQKVAEIELTLSEAKVQLALVSVERDRLLQREVELQGQIIEQERQLGALSGRGDNDDTRGTRPTGLAFILGGASTLPDGSGQTYLPTAPIVASLILLAITLLIILLFLVLVIIRGARTPAIHGTPAGGTDSVWVRMSRSQAREFARIRRSD